MNRVLRTHAGMQGRGPNPLQTQTSQTFIVVFRFPAVNYFRLTLANTGVHSTFEMRDGVYNRNLVEINRVVPPSSRKPWGPVGIVLSESGNKTGGGQDCCL